MPEKQTPALSACLLYARPSGPGRIVAGPALLLPWLLPSCWPWPCCPAGARLRLLMERLHTWRARRRIVYRGSHRCWSGRAGAGGMAGLEELVPVAACLPCWPGCPRLADGLERWAYRSLPPPARSAPNPLACDAPEALSREHLPCPTAFYDAWPGGDRLGLRPFLPPLFFFTTVLATYY